MWDVASYMVIYHWFFNSYLRSHIAYPHLGFVSDFAFDITRSLLDGYELTEAAKGLSKWT